MLEWCKVQNCMKLTFIELHHERIHSSLEFLRAFSNCRSVLSIQVAPKGNNPSMNPKWPPLCGTMSTVSGLDWNLSMGRPGT